ncbi:non-ribosomal peptide synthetase [Crocosphaera chwakensis]|uniref:Peptide synthetase n=1 Tax=Crocosphaera chwakensis CCY0110 TaxID=391612 RepID=A3INW8_9CHRO|nr:non-ribosomal peptide synthetase [Crocosphaera chwakensis]EAZ91770.1 peptide synthetase [Crocosphaera chwakensis CCY0110]
MRAEDLELFEYLLEDEGVDSTSPQGIPLRDNPDEIPLSSAQTRLWFLTQLDPESCAYNLPGALQLTGKLNFKALEDSINEIVQRHEVLRTNFREIEGQPQAHLIPNITVTIPIIDLRSHSPEDTNTEIERLSKEEEETPFNLAESPLIRLKLLRLTDDEQILLLNLHHIVADAWSKGVFIEELKQLYYAFSLGKPSPLPVLPIQYADFAHWQQKRLQGELLTQQLDYWKQQLTDITPLSLPIDKPRPLTQTFNGAGESFILPSAVTEQLNALAKQQDATLFMTLLSAFFVLLYRYTQQEDICIGSPIANRSHQEVEPLIGFFLNTLVFRANLSKNPSFLDVLNRVKKVCLEAYENQDFPFEKLVEQLQPSRHLNHSPLFQVLFTLQKNTAKENLSLPGLSVEVIEKEWTTAKFDLSLNMEETDQGLRGMFEYKTDLFEPETIQRMVGHFLTLLNNILSSPNQSIQTVPLLTELERQNLLIKCNKTDANYPKNSCLHQLLETQAEKTPDRVAIEFNNKKLTYSQLNQKANQLAYHLQQSGVKPNNLVAICVERSIEMLIGLLAILKAGGTYIPIDPTYPSERINYILEHSQVNVILTQSWVWKENREKYTIIAIDKITLHPTPYTPHPHLTPQDLAYIIYTSGSTGKPKGVEISHQGIVNFLWSMAQQPGINSDDILLSVTTLSFDIAGLELFLPLITGAKVVIVSRQTVIDGVALSQKIDQSNASMMQATPATWQMLIDAGWKGKKDLKILCGGEALSKTLVKELLTKSQELWNMYGPTETTVWSMIEKIETEDNITIGRPINNTQIYILDNHLQPVPIGIPGELYIGGDGLARGYVNRRDLTEERFINSPFNPGKKIYKTGDIAKYLPNGKVEYIGRSDYQVKIRGFRIELGEIESQLNQHLGVKNAVVVAKKEASGINPLVAYYVSQKESNVTDENLRDFLKKKLPDYMMPLVFISLAEFPLTPNGKIDRKALPEPRETFTDKAFTAPHTPTEKELVSIWQEILGVIVGINNDFFALGGHSLLATQVISRIRQKLKVEIPLRSLFEFSTIAQLSQVIDNHNITAKPIIKKVSRQQPLPLSFAQQRLWFLDQLEPENHAYNMSGAIQLQGELNEEALEKSINEIVRRHEVLRTTFNTNNGQPIQVIKSQNYIPLDKENLQLVSRQEKEEKIKEIAIQETEKPFNLEKDSLLRTKLLKLEENSHILLFTLHHIIFDIWSTGVIIKELSTLYHAFCQNQPSPLPELPIQYADFAYWQHQWLQGKTLKQEYQYWLKKLENFPTLNLAEINKKIGTISHKNLSKGSQTFTLSPTLSQQLNKVSQQTGVTLFMTILAALNVLLHRHTKENDIVIGTDVANRNHKETEVLIGFFINIILLRNDLSGKPSFRELLSQIRETTLEAYAHQDFPFAKLVEILQPERSLDQTPLFQVLLVFQNAPVPPLELSGLTIKPLQLYEGEARFDLVLFIEETSEGIKGTWKYKSNILNPSTIYQLSNHFQTLLQKIVNNPDLTIEELEMQSEAEKEQKIQQQSQREKAKLNKFKKFKRIQPKAVVVSSKQLIKTEQFKPNEPLPLIIQPNINDIDIMEWAKNNRPYLEEKLQQHGAILFRGFNFNQVSDFETLSQAICPNLFGNYGDLPREGISNKVYGSTPYPADKAILFHNESSHLNSWPQKIWFFCVQPAEQGGETPIVDCRKIYQKLDSDIIQTLEEKQLMYVRNYSKDFDVSWQEFFKTDNKKQVESYCKKNTIEWEWLPNDGLRTKKVSPAIIQHPTTQECVFFNQVQLHHISFLDSDIRQSLLSNFGYEGLPRNVYYGDGSPIEDKVMNQIKTIYQNLSVSFAWQKGDILMLDNMLTAHSRNPYQGKRKIVVAMGNLVNLHER